MQQSRDPDIRRIEARGGFRSYGTGLGIILLKDVYPGFPRRWARCPGVHPTFFPSRAPSGRR